MDQEPRYIHYDPDGKMLGHYANQHSFTSGPVPPDHPDILAWEDKRKSEQEAFEAKARENSPDRLMAKIAALEARLAKLEG